MSTNFGRYNVIGIVVCLILILGGGCLTAAEGESPSSLLGKWEYVDCAIKNTTVKGTIAFSSNGAFTFAGQIHEDYPTLPFQGTYKYSVNENELSYIRVHKDKTPPVLTYFLIEGDFLYFSEQPMESVQEDRAEGYRSTNWDYKLKRVKP